MTEGDTFYHIVSMFIDSITQPFENVITDLILTVFEECTKILLLVWEESNRLLQLISRFEYGQQSDVVIIHDGFGKKLELPPALLVEKALQLLLHLKTGHSIPVLLQPECSPLSRHPT